MSGDNVIRLNVEMTGQRAEDSDRRVKAIAAALGVAANDPQILVRMSLGRAYSDLHVHDIPRREVIEHLRELFADDSLHKAALAYYDRLGRIVAARTNGDRCGDYISQFQRALLAEVLNSVTEGPPDAAA